MGVHFFFAPEAAREQIRFCAPARAAVALLEVQSAFNLANVGGPSSDPRCVVPTASAETPAATEYANEMFTRRRLRARRVPVSKSRQMSRPESQ